MGSINPPVKVVDKEILDTLIGHIEQMLADLPSSVISIGFVVTMDTYVEKARGDHWAHYHGFDYKDVIEQMARDARLGELGSRTSFNRINVVCITEWLPGKVEIHLDLYEP